MGYLARKHKSPFLTLLLFSVFETGIIIGLINGDFSEGILSIIWGTFCLVLNTLILGILIWGLNNDPFYLKLKSFIINHKWSIMLLALCGICIFSAINMYITPTLSLGIITASIVIYHYVRRPIITDRRLYGSNPLWMIWYVVFAIAAIFSITSGLIGTCELFKPEEIVHSEIINSMEDPSLEWNLWSQFTDPGNLPSASNLRGRIGATIFALLGIILLSGFFVSSIVNFISRRANNWKNGLIHYKWRRFKKYVVIIGVNDLTAHIIKTILKQDGVRYILIQTRQDVEKMRMRLDLSLDKNEEDRLVFYYGERTSYEDINKLSIEKAEQIFILGEDITFENEKDHDAYNIECLEHLSKYIEDYNQKSVEKNKITKTLKKFFGDKGEIRKRCHVNFEYQSTFTAFKATHMYQQLSKSLVFLPFNIHEVWAKKVLVDNFAIVPSDRKGEVKVQRYVPFDTYIDCDGIEKGITEKCYSIRKEKDGKEKIEFDKNKDCNKTVHFIIMGMNQMGTALATQVALLSHFPNFGGDEDNSSEKKRTTITFIDDHAKTEGEYLMGRYASLFSVSRYRTIICGEEKLKYSKKLNPVSSKEYKNNRQSESHCSEIIDPLLNEDNKYSQFKESFTDIQWEFIQGNIAEEKIQNYITDIINDETNITTIAICFNDPQQTIASALYLPRAIFGKVRQVLVYQQNSFDIIERIAAGEHEWKRYDKLKPFGMVEGCYTESLFDSMAAKVDRFIYQQLKAANDKFPKNTQITELPTKVKRDSTLLSRINEYWDTIGIVEKLTSIDSAESIQIRLRSMGITYTGNPYKISKVLDNNKRLYEVLANTEHRRWMTQRLITGFRPLENGSANDNMTWSYFVNKNLDFNLDKGKRKQDELRRYLEVNKRAHLDICPSFMLDKIGSDMHTKDLSVICYTQLLLVFEQWVNILRLADKNCRKRNAVKLLGEFIFDRKKEIPNDFCFISKDHPLNNPKLKKGQRNLDKLENHGFWLAKNVVTVKQWKSVTGVDKSNNKVSLLGRIFSKLALYKSNYLPITDVSKKEVEDFLTILRKRTGVYFTIPSLKEWRYAALVSNGYTTEESTKEMSCIRSICSKISFRVFNHTNQIKSSKYWFNRKGVKRIKRTKSDNPMDMLGNVWEWTRTSDELHPNEFCICGGSWKFGHKECALTTDYWSASRPADLKSSDVGFRLIWKFDCDIEEASTGVTPQKVSQIISKGIPPTILNKNIKEIKEWLDSREIEILPGYFVMGTENHKERDFKSIISDASNDKDDIRKAKKLLINYQNFPEERKDVLAGDEETPHHIVHISKTFYMCDIPVTQYLWNLVTDKNATENKSSNLGDDYPQTNVSYKDVCDFIRLLNSKLHEAKLLDSDWEYRLPTEAEWEYAAKDGHVSSIAKEIKNYVNSGHKVEDIIYNVLKKNKYCYYSGSDIIDEVAWYNQGTTHKVGMKVPNGLRLYDMSGNIWEWCKDFYQSNFYEDCVTASITDKNGNIRKEGINDEIENNNFVKDPECIDKSYSAHVYRGGSWKSPATDCRCTRANYWIDTYKSNDLGFRLVKAHKQ